MAKKSVARPCPHETIAEVDANPMLEGEDFPTTESDLDEIIALLRQAIWKYHELVEKGECKLDQYGQSLEIIGKAGARLGRLIEIRKKWSGAEDGKDKFRKAVLRLIHDLDQSMSVREEKDADGD
ncbi:MAG: hypothetical protein CVU41_12655 [Chloroflexi bacterium HGW-Chloroflexi-3]|nr:MAG: hypothetical protein CVU41_12655 [Chloroflexi bacterium HGW-Chloroflexi-3]